MQAARRQCHKGIKSYSHWNKDISRGATSRRQEKSYYLLWNLISGQLIFKLCAYIYLQSHCKNLFLILQSLQYPHLFPSNHSPLFTTHPQKLFFLLVSLPHFFTLRGMLYIFRSSEYLPVQSVLEVAPAETHQDALLVPPAGLQGRSQPTPHYFGPLCTGVNTTALVCFSDLISSDEARDYLKEISRKHQLQHFHTLLFLSSFRDLPFCFVVPLFHLPFPF